MSAVTPLDDPAVLGPLPDLRPDLAAIAAMVEPGARVLDIGCEDGQLLQFLVRTKGVRGRGLELSQEGVNASVRRGLSVVQGDADRDLVDYPDRAFDTVILSQTLQATRWPDRVLAQLVRIGHRAVVSFPNFGYWRVRLSLLMRGRMPVTPTLPRSWYETENIHLCTIRDFVTLAEQLGVRIERALTLDAQHRLQPIRSLRRANLFAQTGLFVLTKG
ncbi:MAG TPA: methionine biosynthesis protein MetW [Kiloniellales bacterium]|nr:methionine biosynthesis protein MetW [Kiloniellales bacterium]